MGARRLTGRYPEELLARPPAPPYRGEGPFALWHISEDPALDRFVPRVSATHLDGEPLVWAVDTRHLPMFWFPRDCPRGCIWTSDRTTAEDRDRFFGQSASRRIHVIEAAWLQRVQRARLFAYRMDPAAFRPHEVGGYWVSDESVDATERAEISDLLGRHAAAEIELRITPSITPFWTRVIESTVEFSGLRLQNAASSPAPA